MSLIGNVEELADCRQSECSALQSSAPAIAGNEQNRCATSEHTSKQPNESTLRLDSNTEDDKTHSELPKPKVGRKPENNGLSKRKDIVLKCVLRKIRAFYKDYINSTTKYQARKRWKAPSFLHDCLEHFVAQVLDIPPTPNAVLLIGKPSRRLRSDECHLFLAAVAGQLSIRV